MSSAYVQVARRRSKPERPPNNLDEASQSEFMEYRAFTNPRRNAGQNWGEEFLNSIIATNEGQPPEAVREIMFDDLSFDSRTH